MQHRYYVYILISSSLLLMSCLGTRYLQKNEYLLADQCVVGNKKIKKKELALYYLQDINRKFLGIPIGLWMYELGKFNFDQKTLEKKYKRVALSYDKKLAAAVDNPQKWEKLQKAKKQKLAAHEASLKNGNFLMQLGEAPVIYTPEKRAATEKNLLQYLHTKGYFNARVTSTVKIKDKKAYIVYSIREDKPFMLQDITLYSPDEAIEQLLQPYAQESLLKEGQHYDQGMFLAERERIYDLLLDNGYWNFNKQYIGFNVDTTSNNQAVAVETVVSLPTDGQSHPVYHLDDIEFSVSAEPSEQQHEKITTPGGITFQNIQQHFSTSSIIGKIPLQIGQAYSKHDIMETQKRLTSLGIFTHIHVSHDTLEAGHLKTHIYASLRDKFQLEQEIGTEFTKISSIPFYQLSFKSKNLFKKLEILTIRSQFSIEMGSIPTDGQKAYIVQNFHTAAELTLPQFLVPLPANNRAKLDADDPHTKVGVGYTFASQANYTRRHVTTLLSYTWYPWATTTFELIPFSMNLMDFKLKAGFEKELQARKDQGDFSYKRYKPALHSYSSIKTTFTRRDKHKGKNEKNYSYTDLLLESGGALQNLINFKTLFGSRLAYYKYLKGSISYSQHIPLQAGTVFAYHLNTGILYPYNFYKVAPPDRYYFIGGPNSVRAWGSRSLGPGSYRAVSTKQQQFFEERPGEFILQTNVELRQHLIGFLEGAFFIDMGNVWMLQKTNRVGEDFELTRFYKEIAIGTGLGLRLNFNFLVLRVDLGIKLYDPALPLGARLFPETMFRPTINFSLGDPF